MDAGYLKNEDCQDYLSELASIPQVQMIISIDHMGASRLWNDTHLDKMNLYCIQLDTFLPFDKEFIFQPPLFSAKNDN